MRVAAAILAAVVLAGCSATPRAVPEVAVETLPVQRGADGTTATWTEMLDAIADADVVILGEQHDDATGHQVQLAVVRHMVETYPGTAVSMEMLDRSKQAAVDDYLAGYIKRDKFVERAKTGWKTWDEFYQPVVDAAKDAGSPVVAANTPWAVYTSVARREGYEALDDVTAAQAMLFVVPDELPGGRYRERFWEVIAGRAEGEPPDTEAADAPAGHGHDLSDEAILGMYRGQALTDATMAASIAAVLEGDTPKTVHLVGAFHCDYEGGLVQEIRQRAPGARVLVISMPREDLDGEDGYGRADFLVDTRE